MNGSPLWVRLRWLRERGAAAPVAVAQVRSYDEDLAGAMRGMFSQLGGLERVVRGKTIKVKLNLTGSPALRVQGRPLGVTHYTHPKTASAMAFLLNEAGARRVRFVESCWATAGPLDEYLLESGWNVRIAEIGGNVELVNTTAAGKGGRYSRFKVPGGGLVFPAYDLHPAYAETDVFVSMAKMKNHETCGVTLAMKNVFGITPASVYGDDAGVDEPNESPGKGRVDTSPCGKATAGEERSGGDRCTVEPGSGHRMPRITAELNAARPIDIAFVDGIETLAGGEGRGFGGSRPVAPGLLVAGWNAV